jgi:hypothetical protein
MAADKPGPHPPGRDEEGRVSRAPIADVRARFAKQGPQTDEERARARAFIEGKIAMVKGDPRLSAAEKAAAIADIEARR